MRNLKKYPLHFLFTNLLSSLYFGDPNKPMLVVEWGIDCKYVL